MSAWAEKAAENMIHLSQADTLAVAMREWGTTGNFEDTHNIEEVCELCEHEGLRYLYEIENRHTNHALWVGSTCITKFVPLFEGETEIVGEEAKASFLRRWQAAYEAGSRQDRAFEVLRQLAAKEPAVFQQQGWRLHWKRGYSVKQVQMLSMACKQFRIPLSVGDFRINTRRDAIVRQVRALQQWQYRRLRPAIPQSRHAEFDEFFR